VGTYGGTTKGHPRTPTMILEGNDMSLTDLEVKDARPQERPFKLNDGKGLFLHISPPPGKKTWRHRYKITGKESVIVIGEYPDMTLLSARVEGEAMRRKVKAGINPSKERQAVKQAAFQEKEKEVQVPINSFHLPTLKGRQDTRQIF